MPTAKKIAPKTSLAKPAAKKATVQTKAKTTRKAKPDLVKKYRSHKTDTGSVEVQVAQLSQKISQLSKHLRKHHKDNDSKRGLLQMIGKRRRLLNYLKRRDEKRYDKLILDLGLRR